jgi:uncharacterized protein YdhG (YjbR/CyaY superfamily)
MTMNEIDAYIASQDPGRQPLLKQVRKTIHQALPDAQEKIAWGMPTWKKKHNIIHFAAQKKHLGIYPGPDTIVHFQKEFERRGYAWSKGAVQIPFRQPLPLELIRDMALYSASLD